ncbi:hypothetical protein E3N88_16005 [Mikania micrantha]|uniref:Uncharacterized protein n=1 Tax=Mikania micrantha TaxID=192012 RepID=A0A5N6P095_9ASTR|nr:hypothetical protein E3N88_16005 [Mikania micrantha]
MVATADGRSCAAATGRGVVQVEQCGIDRRSCSSGNRRSCAGGGRGEMRPMTLRAEGGGDCRGNAEGFDVAPLNSHDPITQWSTTSEPNSSQQF